MDSVPSERGEGATASTMPLRALENQLGSSKCYTTDAVFLNTRGGNPQLVLCKVSGRSHDVRESRRRPNMREKTAPTAVSSHELPSVVQALTTRAARLCAHNPDCDSCMCDWLTGLHGGSLWSCHVSLDRRIRRGSPTFFLTSASCLLRVNRSLPFFGPSTAICSGSRGSRLASSCAILRTLYSKGWATNRPPIQGTIDQKVALSGVDLLHILLVSGRDDRRPVKGRHVASPIENLRIVILHC